MKLRPYAHGMISPSVLPVVAGVGFFFSLEIFSFSPNPLCDSSWCCSIAAFLTKPFLHTLHLKGFGSPFVFNFEQAFSCAAAR